AFTGSVSASMSAHRSTHIAVVMVVVGVVTMGVGRLLVGGIARCSRSLRPIFLAVDPRQHLRRETAGRPVVNDLARTQPNNPGQEHLRESYIVDIHDRRETTLRAQLGNEPHDLA